MHITDRIGVWAGRCGAAAVSTKPNAATTADEDKHRHDEAGAVAVLAERIRQHERAAAERQRAHEAHWDSVAARVMAGDEAAVDTLMAASLSESTALHGFIESGRTTYDAASRELVLELDIPDTDVVPDACSWRYVSSKAAIVAVPIKPAETARTYATFVAQIILAALDVCFRSIGPEVVDVVSVNGHVQTIDPATGQPDHPCLIVTGQVAAA